MRHQVNDFGQWGALFPQLRARGEDAAAATLSETLDDVVLTYRGPRRGLAAVSPKSPEGNPPRGDRRSDQQLLLASRGADPRAFRELDRRYRRRIRRLAISMNFSSADADEIAQESLLGLFLGRETSPDHCNVEDLIDALVATNALAFLRCERHQKRLQRP
jgi:hypothetical protein